MGRFESIHFTDPDSAVLLAKGGTIFEKDGPVRRPSVQTYVAVRTSEGWRFQSFQNGRMASLNALDYAWLGIKTALFGL